MRTLILVGLMLSAPAFACPDLSGTFRCQYQDGSVETLTIAQDNKSGVEVYNYNGSEIAADNVTRVLPDDANLKSGTFRAWCDDNTTLKAELISEYWDNSRYIGDLTMNMFFTMENGSHKSKSTGVLKTGNGDHPIDSTTVCRAM